MCFLHEMDGSLNINWLKDYLALVEMRHFTRAAARRSISQAAFSRRIKSLENWLGTPLIVRGGRGVQLTREGRLFEQEARHLLSLIHTSRNNLHDASIALRGHLTISMSQTIATTSFSTWWDNWRGGLPVDITTRIGNISEAVSDFITGHSDLLICHSSQKLPVMLDPHNFHSHIVEKDELVPVVAANTALAKKVEWAQRWEDVPLVHYAPNRYFARLVSSLIEQAPFLISGPAVVQTEMSDVVLNCVARGMGIGWMPRSVIAGASEITIIDEPSLTMDLEAVAFIGKHSTSQSALDIWQAICSDTL